MPRSHSRIEAQRDVLRELLDRAPTADDFNPAETEEWVRFGMGPKFFTASGITAMRGLIAAKLDELDDEEAKWRESAK